MVKIAFITHATVVVVEIAVVVEQMGRVVAGRKSVGEEDSLGKWRGGRGGERGVNMLGKRLL